MFRISFHHPFLRLPADCILVYVEIIFSFALGSVVVWPESSYSLVALESSLADSWVVGVANFVLGDHFIGIGGTPFGNLRPLVVSGVIVWSGSSWSIASWVTPPFFRFRAVIVGALSLKLWSPVVPLSVLRPILRVNSSWFVFPCIGVDCHSVGHPMAHSCCLGTVAFGPILPLFHGLVVHFTRPIGCIHN